MRGGEEVGQGGQLALLIPLGGGGGGERGRGKHVFVTNCIHVHAVFPSISLSPISVLL